MKGEGAGQRDQHPDREPGDNQEPTAGQALRGVAAGADLTRRIASSLDRMNALSVPRLNPDALRGTNDTLRRVAEGVQARRREDLDIANRTQVGVARLHESFRESREEIANLASIAAAQLTETQALLSTTERGQARADRSDRTMRRLTWVIAGLTACVAIFTVLLFVFTVLPALRATPSGTGAPRTTASASP
jgi:hypothetical protein